MSRRDDVAVWKDAPNVLTYRHHKLSSYDPFMSSHSLLRLRSRHFPRVTFTEIN